MRILRLMSPSIIVCLAAQGQIIVDHTCTHIEDVPQYWVQEAKATLHIAYGHTSHGSQVTEGMTGLADFMNARG